MKDDQQDRDTHNDGMYDTKPCTSQQRHYHLNDHWHIDSHTITTLHSYTPQY